MNPLSVFTSACSQARRAGPTLKLLPALVLGCFAAQPLLAQTTEPAAAPPAATVPAGGAAAPARAQPGTRTRPAASPAAPGKDAAKPDAPAAAPDEMAVVEVVAARPTNKVDRDVYDLKNDISTSNASAADVLNNVPSVSVDQDGNVALRGNTNVQIMVNGKRDAQFQGQNRGDALNAFAAENIETIEVINVPGAEFGNEGGSGPIINLVLKRSRKAGSRANLSANKGTGERYNTFLNGEHAAGPYSISGNIGVRKYTRTNHHESEREDLDPATGAVTGGANSRSDSRAPSQAVLLSSTLTYNVGERDQAGATVSFSKMKNEGAATSETNRFGPGRAPVADFGTRSASRSPAQNMGFGVSYDHHGDGPGEELKLDLRYTGQDNNSDSDVRYDYRLRPDRPVADNHRETDRRNRILDVSADYQRTVWDTWQLKAGLKYADSRNDNDTNYLAVDPLTGGYEPVPSRISQFQSNDRTAAAYGIASTTLFKDLRLQGGLRGEYTALDVRQPLLAQEDSYRYMNWLPSLYATWGLGETAQLQLRASRRISRPNERDLNPNLVYLSDFSARQGNPDLEPVNNDLYELAYRDRFFNVDTSVVLFKRREAPVIGNRSYPLASDPNVLVTSPINFGANDSTGVDLNFNVRQLFLKGLSANLGATVGNERRTRLFNYSTSSQALEQSNQRRNAKLRLAYQADAESLQLSVNHTGQTLNGQGINQPVTMTNFSWQHRLSPRMTLNLNVINVFQAGNIESTTENEVLRLHSLSTGQPRIFSLGLRYQWGGVTGDQRVRNGGRRQGEGPFRGGHGREDGGGRESGGHDGPGGYGGGAGGRGAGGGFGG